MSEDREMSLAEFVLGANLPYDHRVCREYRLLLFVHATMIDAHDRMAAALTEIRDILPIQNDEYARRVFAIAAEALEPETGYASTCRGFEHNFP
jgi:hypothetical protein